MNHTAVPNKRQMAAGFDAAAADYDRLAVLQQTVEAGLLERLQMMRIAPRRILDLGAGTGSAARALARRYRGSRVIQADIAPNMLRQSRRRARRWLSQQQYVCADAESLPFESGSVDLVFSSLMLQWCPDQARTFAEIRRIMRPGSLFLFSSLGPDTLTELRESWEEAGDADVVHVNGFYDMHDVGDALLRAGFADPIMEVDTLILTYDRVWDLMRELKWLGARNVTAGRRRSLTGRRRMEQVVAAYEKRRARGRLPATYEVVYGHAWVPDAPPQQRAADGSVSIPVSSVRRRG